jgi:transposase
MVLPPEVVELIDSLKREIEALRTECAALRAENAELRRRLGLDSSNSSKPPSSDGLKKKPRVLKSLRTRTGKPSGGQRGHDGDTLRQVAEPDAIVAHAPEVCERCEAPLPADSKVGEERRQVFDLPERPLLVTEHRAAVHACPACRWRTRAAFPEGVVSPAQYGERVRAAAVYLNAQQLVPEERTAQILNDLFDAAAACGASVARWVRRKAEALEPVWRGIGACVAAAPVRCLDETGFRIAGKTQWLHTASTLTHTFYRAGEPRSAVPEFEGGVVVHDHWRAYYALENVLHAFCNAHLLRELQAVCEFDKEPWAEALRATLLDANEAVQKAKAAGLSALPPETVKAFEDRYWAAVREGLALHRSLPDFDPEKSPKKRKKQRPAHNLLIRFKTFKDATLRFLVDFNVPFTNNLAEQDLRMMKVKIKISGGFRTLQGAADFASLRSVISSARKQGLDILQALTLGPNQLAVELKI